MITVPVELGDRRYEVLVGDGVRAELASVVRARTPRGVGRAAVVTQAEVAAAGWLDHLDPGVPFEVHLIGEGEEAKSLATVEELCRQFSRHGLARGDVVVAVGGGIVTDVAGFAAATYHRGIPYVNIATTLLAQVDAAVGGKTGVNLPEGKNLVGAFWQPSGVLCDTATLSTLPGREWACGRGEMAKYALLERDTPADVFLGLPIAEQVARCVRAKARVVVADEHEGGARMVLNYGHTLAHALEAAAFAVPGGGDPGAAAGYGPSLRPAPASWDLRHGEAVAVGLVFAAFLARRMGRIDDDRVAVHRQVVEAFGLPTALPAGAEPGTLLSLMARDKKAHHDLTFVLDGPDGVEVVRGVDGADVLATLAEMGAHA